MHAVCRSHLHTDGISHFATNLMHIMGGGTPSSISLLATNIFTGCPEDESFTVEQSFVSLNFFVMESCLLNTHV